MGKVIHVKFSGPSHGRETASIVADSEPEIAWGTLSDKDLGDYAAGKKVASVLAAQRYRDGAISYEECVAAEIAWSEIVEGMSDEQVHQAIEQASGILGTTLTTIEIGTLDT
jgi:hypothetical protein